MILGSRWSTEILNEFVTHGARRFQDLLDALQGLSARTLSNRLKLFEDHGILERRFYDQHPPRAEYVLTEKGRKMDPIFRAMRNWSAESG